MNRDRINYLLEQYAGHAASEEEVNEFFTIIRQADDDDFIKGWLTETLETIEPARIYDKQKWQPVLQQVFGRKTERPEDGESQADSGESLVVSMKPRIQTWKRIAVAASIIGVLFFAGYWFVNRQSSVDPSTIAQGDKANDVKAPDKNRASIKLADGRIVYLDSAGNGELVDVNGVKVVKTADGKIEYSGALRQAQGDKEVYNTLYNPRGSIVMDMTLSDGSRVWLNAGSSITYPVAFVGNERKVSISGEAYFEVAHDTSKPFFVSKGDMQVQVLGTHFNVNAYDDESDIKITLLEGSVRVLRSEVPPSVRDDNKAVVLKPGQQAQVTSDIKVVNAVDVDAVIAWKNGLFKFDKTDIQTMMRQAERWYDITVSYPNGIPTDKFGGELSRNVNLSQFLKILEYSDVNAKIEGRVVTILK